MQEAKARTQLGFPELLGGCRRRRCASVPSRPPPALSIDSRLAFPPAAAPRSASLQAARSLHNQPNKCLRSSSSRRTRRRGSSVPAFSSGAFPPRSLARSCPNPQQLHSLPPADQSAFHFGPLVRAAGGGAGSIEGEGVLCRLVSAPPRRRPRLLHLGRQPRSRGWVALAIGPKHQLPTPTPAREEYEWVGPVSVRLAASFLSTFPPPSSPLARRRVRRTPCRDAARCGLGGRDSLEGRERERARPDATSFTSREQPPSPRRSR